MCASRWWLEPGAPYPHLHTQNGFSERLDALRSAPPREARACGVMSVSDVSAMSLVVLAQHHHDGTKCLLALANRLEAIAHDKVLS